MKSKIPYHKVERYSFPYPKMDRFLRVLKRNEFEIEKTLTVSGDAPKELIRIYEYCKGVAHKKEKRRAWPLFIAKTGHKWYPLESVTELLLNKLGTCFGLTMAESNIMIIGGQVRFLSKYFLDTKSEGLIHGAEIFAGLLDGDDDFVKEIENEGLARDFFSLQFVEKAIKYGFPNDYEEIMHDLVRLLLFDALVGNNDRHYFNWGVICSIKRKSKPRFSPIYDTARGLFWNWDEETMINKTRDKNYLSQYVKKYCDNAKPKLGWDGEQNINLFRMVYLIYSNSFHISKPEVRRLFDRSIYEQMRKIIQEEFGHFFSQLRLSAILQCLEYRYNTIVNLLYEDENNKNVMA